MEDQSKYEEGFIMLRSSVAREFPGKSLTKALVYSIIEGFENAGLECWITNEQLAEKLNISETAVKRAIKHLKDKDYIRAFVYGSAEKGIRNRKMMIKFNVSSTNTKRKKK